MLVISMDRRVELDGHVTCNGICDLQLMALIHQSRNKHVLSLHEPMLLLSRRIGGGDRKRSYLSTDADQMM